jgi:hypothetical protein
VKPVGAKARKKAATAKKKGAAKARKTLGDKPHKPTF